MKNSYWLTLYGGPVAAIIIMFVSFGALFLLLQKKTLPSAPAINAPAVKYPAMNGKAPIESEEIAEIRAVYASDLFASARNDQFSALTITRISRSNQTNTTLAETPLFLSSLPAAGKAGPERFATRRQSVDDLDNDSTLLPRFSPRSDQQIKKYPGLSIELKGELKQFRIEPAIFSNIVLLADQKPWSIQAEICFNKKGFVDYLFVESADGERALYQKIINRLYQCRLSNVTQACAGTIIINYPVYSATNP